MDRLILKFAEKHPIVFGLIISALVMAIVDSEVFSLGLSSFWAILGLGYFFKAVDKEGNKW